ncbi:hypothetical protein NDU88_002940 [Pleurodeles waltl]|uniref:Uncharacterized protein n=1 Tax=Pleurodeles waltl TaxID=8319 RepID=A0AAV7NJ84_PLEWA|nr:hypothetical protein NDU88_002940 [Pleurodeles waltl]
MSAGAVSPHTKEGRAPARLADLELLLAKHLPTRRWKAALSPTVAQWSTEVLEWGKAESEAIRREERREFRKIPMALDWDEILEEFKKTCEEDDVQVQI